jgi:hypothetical protein
MKIKVTPTSALCSWLRETVSSSEAVLAEHLKSCSESHNALSLAIYLCTAFVIGAPDRPVPPQQQRRRLVSLWAASRFAKDSISSVMLSHCATLIPTPKESESDMFKRFQRIFLTVSSVKDLLLMDHFDLSLESYSGWTSQIQMFRGRLQAMEAEVVEWISGTLSMFSDHEKMSTLVDPQSFGVAMSELHDAWSSTYRALVVDVPIRYSTTIDNMMKLFEQQCADLEQEAAQLIDSCAPDGIVNPNVVLEQRHRVAELQHRKMHLIKNNPNPRGGGAPGMFAVDALVKICLPE